MSLNVSPDLDPAIVVIIRELVHLSIFFRSNQSDNTVLTSSKKHQGGAKVRSSARPS